MFRNEQALTLRQFVGRLQANILSGQQEEDAELPGTAEAGPVPYIRIMTIHRAKGLQFPIVIIPEIQAPLKREYNPPNFLITPGYGLDVRLPLRDQRETRSASFNQNLADATRSSVEEAMRIFYVAVTRAQHQVILIGSGRTSPLDPSAPRYAWLDEILRAGSRLRSLGAQLSGRVR
ncbi:MAG: 3'-5' exonuclease [Thermomicrobiales bacterium]